MYWFQAKQPKLFRNHPDINNNKNSMEWKKGKKRKWIICHQICKEVHSISTSISSTKREKNVS